MTRWSLCGLIIHLANKALDYDQRAIKSEKDFRSLHFSDATYFPGPFKLPYPVQRLVVDELKEGNLLLEEEKEGREIKDEITCDCLFWQKYQLPCRHLWLSHHIFDLGFWGCSMQAEDSFTISASRNSPHYQSRNYGSQKLPAITA